MIDYALSLIGTKWLPGGRDVEAGLDCYGLVHHLYRHCFNVVLPEHVINFEDYKTIHQAVDAELDDEGNWRSIDSPVDWSVVGMSTSKVVIHHVGISLLGKVLHAVPNTGVVFQDIHSLKSNGICPRHYWSLR